jgi:regulator of sigma E protease
MEFWIKAAQLILSLSILIVLHEFGHFIPARLFKTRVEKFYLFFNPYFSLFKKKIGDTEWGIGWLPLGGYVKIAGMVDESMDKEQLAQPPQPWEFRSKPAWQRLIVMVGGVVVNVIVGFALFIMITAVWGDEKLHNDQLQHGLAVHPYLEKYGFQSGDKILTIDGQKNDKLPRAVAGDILIFNKRHFKVQHANGTIETIHLPEDVGYKMYENGAEGGFAIRGYFDAVGEIPKKDSPAAKMKLKTGDKILSVNGQEFEFFDEFSKMLYDQKGKKIDLVVERNGKTMTLSGQSDKDGKLGFIPEVKPSMDTSAFYHVDYSFGESFGQGFSRGWKTLYSNVAQFKYVFTAKGASEVGGFGAIGKLFSPTWDWQSFWTLTAIISIALAFMNILPIPALDGGHVMFLLYELITGREPAQRVMEIAQYCGFILLIGLLLYANGNDIIKAISGN